MQEYSGGMLFLVGVLSESTNIFIPFMSSQPHKSLFIFKKKSTNFYIKKPKQTRQNPSPLCLF